MRRFRVFEESILRHRVQVKTQTDRSRSNRSIWEPCALKMPHLFINQCPNSFGAATCSDIPRTMSESVAKVSDAFRPTTNVELTAFCGSSTDVMGSAKGSLSIGEVGAIVD